MSGAALADQQMALFNQQPEPCPDFRPAPGAAWPWCNGCGWRADLHDTEHPVRSAVERLVSR